MEAPVSATGPRNNGIRFLHFNTPETGVWSLVLGVAFAHILNRFCGIEKSKDIEIRKHGNALTQLLHNAEKNDRLISITLDNRKWYVG